MRPKPIIRRIEINFAAAVVVTDEDMHEILRIATIICDRYEQNNPHRTMWTAGIGCKPTFIPMTWEQEQERGIEFDETVFEIECAERENYNLICTKCGKPQGDHRHCITNPPAGDCEFSHQQ